MDPDREGVGKAADGRQAYARQYIDIAEQFAALVRETGMEFEATDRRAEAAARREALRAQARKALDRAGESR